VQVSLISFLPQVSYQNHVSSTFPTHALFIHCQSHSPLLDYSTYILGRSNSWRFSLWNYLHSQFPYLDISFHFNIIFPRATSSKLSLNSTSPGHILLRHIVPEIVRLVCLENIRCFFIFRDFKVLSSLVKLDASLFPLLQPRLNRKFIIALYANGLI
jgi:hypothetical protein